MGIQITLKDYLRELELMEQQYGQEEELYPLVNMILRANCNLDGLSLRDVHKGRRLYGKDADIKIKHQRNFLYGYGSFPDLVLLKEDWNAEVLANKKLKQEKIHELIKKMCGCIEAKTIGTGGFQTFFEGKINNYNLSEISSTINNEEQTILELMWYGKIIYTDGLIWQYLEMNDRILPKYYKYYKFSYHKELKNISFYVKNIGIIKIGDQNFKNNIKEWNRLKYNLSVINWETNDNISKFI